MASSTSSGDHEDTPPDLQLLCKQSKTCPAGRVLVHKSILAEASAVLKDALSLLSSKKAPQRAGPSTDDELKVDGDLDSWTAVIRFLYSPPMPSDKPCNQLTADQVYMIMPVAHRYGFEEIMSLCLQLTSRVFPGCLSCDTYSSFFILKWLNLAADLRLEELKSVCLKKMIEMAKQKTLHSALCLNGEGDKYLPQTSQNNTNKPTQCPICNSNSYTWVWCFMCGSWVCNRGNRGINYDNYDDTHATYTLGCCGHDSIPLNSRPPAVVPPAAELKDVQSLISHAHPEFLSMHASTLQELVMALYFYHQSSSAQ
ncbi:hypothetical protein CEUSTIGMA_g3836.t1 [Chlamydomonas eustigma]|uniref:BTB domain-containing protein n=1 Tax=Chlamydomonas eustigma TaxID=1157962 RepID=A0A250WZY5_9CHLO|nr:hypothetical protein CEUSTIGMA_g3836.t1 [Chlamydomonas eustigma]|eukprot:GAX76391.1 hypothetical protein CEUSTIGMA_g3836.t1 [Chlamydomonas eustigma]